jgi:hypothetical protein
VSVEAISWALNLAPVSPGRANHAGPDGTRQSCYAVGLHPYQFICAIAVPRSPSVKSLILRAAMNRAEYERLGCCCNPDRHRCRLPGSVRLTFVHVVAGQVPSAPGCSGRDTAGDVDPAMGGRPPLWGLEPGRFASVAAVALAFRKSGRCRRGRPRRSARLAPHRAGGRRGPTSGRGGRRSRRRR